MAGGDPLFIGGFDRHDDLAVVAGNRRRVAGIGVGIQGNVQKTQCRTDALANERIVFTDTRRALHPLLAAFQRQALESAVAVLSSP